MATKKKQPGKAKAATPAARSGPKVNWDDKNMRTTFANVVNGTSTREEMSLFFGTNNTWNLQDAGEVTVDLSDRIIMTPHAAKRLATLMLALVKAYEQKYGTINIDLPSS